MSRLSRLSLLGLLLPVVLLAQGAAGDSVRWGTPLGLTVAGGYHQLYGETSYGLDAQVENPYSAGEIVDLRSELVFPLDVGLAEVNLRWRPDLGEVTPLWLAVGFSINTSDPSAKMTDQDWLDHVQFGSTESPSELAWRQVAATAGWSVSDSERIRVSLIAVLDWLQVDHTIIGFDGWYDVGGHGVHVPVSGTDHVIDYRLTSVSPTLGLSTQLRLWRSLELSIAGSGGFAVLMDRDDHILRGRISEGEAVGLGVNSNTGIHWTIPVDGGCALRFGLTGDLRYFHGEGEQKQRWYRDEGDISAGTEVGGIPLTFDGLYYRLGVEAAFSF